MRSAYARGTVRTQRLQLPRSTLRFTSVRKADAMNAQEATKMQEAAEKKREAADDWLCTAVYAVSQIVRGVHS